MKKNLKFAGKYGYSLFKEIFSIITCLFLYPFKSSKLDRPEKLIGLPNVLCVHGYLHNETPWSYFRRYLQSKGFGPVDTVYYQSLLKDIPANSLKIKERIEQIRQETGKEVNILIGHSLGGLVCLEYALEHAPKDKKLYVITMGSPLHATKRATLAYGPSAEQMRADSYYIPWLLDRLEDAKHIHLLTLASTHDLLIRPPKSALMPELSYATCIEIKGIGHVSFLFSRRALKLIVNYLKKHKAI